MNFKGVDQNHVRGDQLKNMDEQKMLSGQQLMDLFRSVLIVPDHIQQSSVEPLVENVMGAINWDIICECVQTARMAELISSTRKILQVCMLHRLIKLPPLYWNSRSTWKEDWAIGGIVGYWR